jgi:WD repeat-containing protein 26
MEEEVVNDFRVAVLAGDYARARELAGRMNMPQGGEAIKRVEYEMYEQEYLEMIEAARKLEAIQVLQREMLPRVAGDKAATERLHVLAQLIMCGDPNGIKGFSGANSSELRKVAGHWRGSGVTGRQDLLEKLQ